MDWKLFIQVGVTVFVAILGGWLGHNLSSRRDLMNERRKLRVSYLLEAYRKLEDAGNRDDPARSWPKFESAIADIQLLGTPRQVRLARQFAHGMANEMTASLDEIINDLRSSLRGELQLPPVEESVVYLRFNGNEAPRFEQTLTAVIRDVEDAKMETAALAAPDARQALEGLEFQGPLIGRIVVAWNALEQTIRGRLTKAGEDASSLGVTSLLDIAVQKGAISQAQQRSLRGLNAMRNLAVHGGTREINAERVQEFLTLAEAMKTVLDITEESGRSD